MGPTGELCEFEVASLLAGGDPALALLVAQAIDLLAPQTGTNPAGERPECGQATGGSGNDPWGASDSAYSSTEPIVHREMTSYPVDRARIDACAHRLMRAFKGHEEIESTDRPGRRLNMRRVVADDDRVFRKVNDGQSRGTAPFVLIVDCSGSMQGYYQEEGRHLVGIMNRLAERGVIQGKVVLTQAHYGHRYQTFDLPVPMAIVERIPAEGSEGLQPTLEAIAPLLETHVVAVYTDACLNDGAVEKAKMHRKGIYTYGMYCGPRERAPKLKDHFDRPLLAKDLESLTEGFTQLLLQDAGRIAMLGQRAVVRGKIDRGRA